MDQMEGLSMDLNRNHYFVAGVLLLLAGFQFRFVSSFVLNEKTTQFVNSKLGQPTAAASPQQSLLFVFSQPVQLDSRRVVRPPKWLSWSLLSVGGVLFAFSLTMRRPGS
jgi:hypothetical protein